MVSILQLFREASGLGTNIQKSSVTPIKYSAQDLKIVQARLPCQVADFPIKYLWPTTVLEEAHQDTITAVHRLVNWPPPWVEGRFDGEGLTSSGSFMWQGHKEIKGRHCLISWPRVTRPKELGGLGISDLKKPGRAQRVRWLGL
jgi:hypothetical protein